MKQLIILMSILFLPILLLECFLQLPGATKLVQTHAAPVEWTDGMTDKNVWKDTIIMGSSLARGSVDPAHLELELKKRGADRSVGSIAVPSDSLSDDYFNLYHILQTCTTCPKNILFVTTDIAFKEQLLSGWIPTSHARIRQHFMADQASFEILAKATHLNDPAYQNILTELSSEQVPQLYFNRRKLLAILREIIFSTLTHQRQAGAALVLTQIASDPGYGFYPVVVDLEGKDPVNSLNNYRSYLGDYKTGGSAEFFFDHFVRLAAENNIKITMLITPLTTTYQSKFPEYIKTYHDFLIRKSAQHGLQIIDEMHFNEANYELFSDANHLNKYGAELFVPQIATQLEL